MHNAPSVSYPVGRCAFVGVVLCVTTLVALGLQTWSAGAWWERGAWVAWRWALCGATWAVTLTWAWWHWWRSPVGWLIWEPTLAEHLPLPARGTAGWLWGAPSGPEGEPLERVEPMVVAQTWILLRLTPSGGGRLGGRWAWARENSAPERWLALRRAVVRHAR